MQALYEQIKARLWVKFAFLSLTSQSFSIKNLQGSPAPFFPSQWDPNPFPSALLPRTRASQSAHAHGLSGESQTLLLYTPCFLWSFPGFCWYRLHFPSNATLQPRQEKPCVFLHKLSFFTSPFSWTQIPDLEIPQGINPRLVRWRSRQECLLPTPITWIPPSGLHCGRRERTDSLGAALWPPHVNLHMWTTTNIPPPTYSHTQIINQWFF